MSKRENGIYVTHGKEMLVGYKALVNGVLSLVWWKKPSVMYPPTLF